MKPSPQENEIPANSTALVPYVPSLRSRVYRICTVWPATTMLVVFVASFAVATLVLEATSNRSPAQMFLPTTASDAGRSGPDRVPPPAPPAAMLDSQASAIVLQQVGGEEGPDRVPPPAPPAAMLDSQASAIVLQQVGGEEGPDRVPPPAPPAAMLDSQASAIVLQQVGGEEGPDPIAVQPASRITRRTPSRSFEFGPPPSPVRSSPVRSSPLNPSVAKHPPVPTVDATPTATSLLMNSALLVQAQLASENVAHLQQKLNEAIRRAERGALYSARSLLIENLREICVVLDAKAGGQSHSRALAQALRAIDEADDFQYQGMQFEADLEINSFVDGHDTPILKGHGQISPLTARQAYYAFARDQLVLASGRELIAARTYYALGRVEESLRADSPPLQKEGPRGIPFFEASLAINSRDAITANELAVALARTGDYRQAANLLVHCVQLAPNRQTLQNLATVYRKLGDSSNAARVEQQLVSVPAPSQPRIGNQVVQVVPADEFYSNPPAATDLAARPTNVRATYAPSSSANSPPARKASALRRIGEKLGVVPARR